MTSQEDLIALLKNYYSEIEPLADTLVRCARTYNDVAYQYYFFDNSDNFLDFDMGLYLKRYLSESYFKAEGALQWNFYVVFLTSKEISESDRRLIESDVDYARKIIVSETELAAWLKRTYQNGNGQGAATRVGLADIWKSLLREKQLDCIFSPQIKLNEGVEKIVLGKYFIEKETKESNRQFQDKDTKLGSLTSFNPTKYRDYPKHDGPFVFKKVNLIDGANGFGKTSLLEGIEFFITGENNRLNDTNDNYEMEGQFANDLHPRKFRKDNPLFRERDRVWYNGMDRTRGSDLSAHFNQFNFFNTDAAFRLTLNKNDDDIENAFRDIALGDEVNLLKRQMGAYETKLQSELKSKKSLIAEYDGDLRTARGLLAELRKSQVDVNRLLPPLYANVSKLKIKADLLKHDLPTLDSLKFTLSVLATELDNIGTDINWIDEVTLGTIRSEDIALKKLNSLAVLYKEAELASQQVVNELSASAKRTVEAITLLEKLIPYYKDQQFEKIRGFSEKLGQQQAKVSLLRKVDKTFSGIRAFEFTFPGRLVGESIQRLSTAINSDRKRDGELAEQIKKAEASLSSLSALIATIKAQGRSYVELATDSDTCPLCQSHFSAPADLRSAILKTLENTVSNSSFNTLLDTRNAIANSIKESSKQQENLQALKNLYQPLRAGKDADTMTVNELLQELEAITSSLPKEELRLSELEQQQVNFKLNNLNEGLLNELSTKYFTLFPAEKLDAGQLDILLQNQKSLQQKNSEEISKERINIAGQGARLLEQIQAYEPRLNIDSLDVLKQRALYAGHYLHEFENLVNEDFDEEFLLSECSLEIQRIMGQLDEIRADMIAQQQESGVATKANNTVSQKTEQRSNAIAEKERIENALETLSSIATNHNEDDFLQEFLDTNKQEIRNTFLAIHSPREFTDIDISEGKIRLIKMNDDITDLHHISTGQRSAMALSLFLTLNNKLQNGPPMIIFDDPVAFTDDLNILSFLDYLREIVLNPANNKQLFFATANENLGFLFQKKFEIFNEDFHHITLQR